MTSPTPSLVEQPDFLLIGAGIMSATLAALIKELKPDATIEIFESLDRLASESSDAWNNAGTGHAALCELNYTPERADGSIDVSKAIEINSQFETSRQFWAWLVKSGTIADPKSFIRSIPHLSFVRGSADVSFLSRRYEALKQHTFFRELEFTTDHEVMKRWMPLIMQGRDPNEVLAATRADSGTDVDFGSLTRHIFEHLTQKDGVQIHLSHRVTDLKRLKNKRWQVTVQSEEHGKQKVQARHVFIGAGGGTLPLLQKSDIPESKGYGGFPVSGQWLRCDNPEIIAQHDAKVYGKASVGAPPMSVPHLDTRVIDGKRSLLFGPYAGFTTKYLKHGSILDFPKSFKPDNLLPMLAAGAQNVELTRYLISQVVQTPTDRLVALREYMPDAKAEDWTLEIAGQRVQVIKKDQDKGGILQFGTEVVTSADGTLSALLGASPGASTSVSIMIRLLENCFPEEMQSSAWLEKFRQMIPIRGKELLQSPKKLPAIRDANREILKLKA